MFSRHKKNIEFKATYTYVDEDEKEQTISLTKIYTKDGKSYYKDNNGKELTPKKIESSIIEKSILENKPFYITPSMLPEDINNVIQDIYSDVLKNKLNEIENGEINDKSLVEEYQILKESYPNFLKKLKKSTDSSLKSVSENVSKNLQSIFSNTELSLEIEGGESIGFSDAELLKSTHSNIHIGSHLQAKMPLSNQGTGLQRMSLIFLIRKMIEEKLIGTDSNKLLLIDEPEAFLHPEAVRELSRSLYKIGEEMPLMISTHSPILIDLSQDHTSIQVFRVNENEAINLFKTEKDKFEENDFKNMKILNYVDSYVNEFFFASNIIVVEGDTEYIAFKHFSGELDENLHIIRARGKSTIVTLMKILNQFNTSYTVLHDVDNDEFRTSTNLKAEKTKCLNILDQKLENVRIYVSISNFENAIGIGKVENNKKTETIYNIVQEHSSENNNIGDARDRVMNLFENIFNEENKNINEDSGFKQIESKDNYDELFDELIKRKKEEEKKEKEKENNK